MRTNYLVEADWLERHLDDPSLRIFDCTVNRGHDSGGNWVTSVGKSEFEKGHVPGGGHLDLVHDLSDPNSNLRFTLPTPKRFADAVSRQGVSDDSRVVLYTTGNYMWATRVWWMFQVFGFDNVAVLDGGWQAWCREGRPISTSAPSHSNGNFTPSFRPELVANKQAVLAALGHSGTCVVNALSPDLHSGESHIHFGPKGQADRKGHIAGSINQFAMDLVDPDTNKMLPQGALEAKFAERGVLDMDRVITYCGAGIAATGDAFALALLGRKDVAVYDASLQEWAYDPALPMEEG